MGVHPNSWMVDFMEHLIQMDDLVGPLWLRKPLKIHAANCWGWDKTSTSWDRVRYTLSSCILCVYPAVIDVVSELSMIKIGHPQDPNRGWLSDDWLKNWVHYPKQWTKLNMGRFIPLAHPWSRQDHGCADGSGQGDPMPRQRLKLYEPAKYPMKPVCAIFLSFFGQTYSHIYIYNIHVQFFFALWFNDCFDLSDWRLMVFPPSLGNLDFSSLLCRSVIQKRWKYGVAPRIQTMKEIKSWLPSDNST